MASVLASVINRAHIVRARWYRSFRPGGQFSIVKYQSVIAATFIVTLRRNDRMEGEKEEEKEQRNLFYKCRVLHCGH